MLLEDLRAVQKQVLGEFLAIVVAIYHLISFDIC